MNFICLENMFCIIYREYSGRGFMNENEAAFTENVMSAETPGRDIENNDDESNVNNEGTGNVYGSKRYNRCHPTSNSRPVKPETEKPNGNNVDLPKSGKPSATHKQVEGAVIKNRRTRSKKRVDPTSKAEVPAESDVFVEFVKKMQDL